MSPLPGSPFPGAVQLLDNYAEASLTDTWIIAYAADSRDSAAQIVAELRSRCIKVVYLQFVPLVDPGFGARLQPHLPDPASLNGRLVVVTLEADSMSHFKTLTAALAPYDPKQVLPMRLISTGPDLMEHGFRTTPAQLSRRNATLLRELARTQRIHITSSGGTDLTVDLDVERFDWISNRGAWRPGSFMILPAGEIATYPADISGTLVADGAINCNLFLHDDLRLGEHPAVITLAGGKATSASCASERIIKLINMNFSRTYGRRVGEIGFGTNVSLTDFVPGNSHLNERFPGVHLGFGSHNQIGGAVDYFEPVHMDLVTNGASIELSDGTTIDLRNFTEKNFPHPTLVRDEDIVGDCCSVGYRESRRSTDREPVTGR